MKLNQLVIVCPFLFCFMSCATMFTGTSSEIGFQSTPPGALVLVDDEEVTTPSSAKVSKSVSSVTFSHPDYDTVEIDLDREFQGGMLLMDFLFTPGFGLSGILVDATTSAFYTMPTIVNYDFESGQVVAGGALPEGSEGSEGSEEGTLPSN